MKALKIIGKVLLIIVIVIVVLAGALIGFLSATEYSPADVEELEVIGSSSVKPDEQPITIMCWNIGYGALGDNADFFMDGGSHVYTADQERVNTNLQGIASRIESVQPDILMLQETDLNSSRSYGIDERATLLSVVPEYDYSFAYNFKTPFVPYPLPPIGKVESGILTFSRFDVTSASRIKLPCPFSWPIRTVNLKRCLMADRIPLGEDGKELVIINLHLEAYDDGEGKIAQTEMLRSFMEAELEKGNYVIAGGDFNQTFSSVDSSMYPLNDFWMPGIIDTNDFSDNWTFLMENKVPSCRSLSRPLEGADKESFQFYIIDGFIVSSNIQVDQFEVLDEGFRYSDHNPVLLTVTLK